MIDERKKMITDKCVALITKAKQILSSRGYNTANFPTIDIKFDLRGTCAGQACVRNNQYYMRFNTDMMKADGSAWNHLYNNTVPHEIAHLVCFYFRLDRGHGRNWQWLCMQLGGNGERCHKEEVQYARGLTYYYTTRNGGVVAMSSVRHRRIQQGTVYRFKDGSAIDRACTWTTTPVR